MQFLGTKKVLRRGNYLLLLTGRRCRWFQELPGESRHIPVEDLIESQSLPLDFSDLRLERSAPAAILGTNEKSRFEAVPPVEPNNQELNLDRHQHQPKQIHLP